MVNETLWTPFSQESFLFELSEFHEVYKLKIDMKTWYYVLEIFMLEGPLNEPAQAISKTNQWSNCFEMNPGSLTPRPN